MRMRKKIDKVFSYKSIEENTKLRLRHFLLPAADVALVFDPALDKIQKV